MENKNVPVLLLFFNREEQTREVFEEIRKYQPKKLYLFQDGPREDSPDDMEKLLACRKVVENIDWDCEVHRNYCEKNMGCDPAEFACVSWVFETEDCVIRFEDDTVPAQSFFRYCEELLEKYKDDKRVFMITGRNQLETTHYCNDASYFFSSVDCIGGFATWKDRWKLLDVKHEFITDPETVKMIKDDAINKYEIERFLEVCRNHREKTIKDAKPASYESPIYAAMLKNHMLNIIPQKNQIRNVGLSADAVHGAAVLDEVLKSDRFVFELQEHEMEFPLVHPNYVINNVDYYNKRNKLLFRYNKYHSFLHKVQVSLYNRRNILKRKLKK